MLSWYRQVMCYKRIEHKVLVFFSASFAPLRPLRLQAPDLVKHSIVGWGSQAHHQPTSNRKSDLT